MRIIRSEDGINWKSVALLEKSGIDLRDPKLSITPEGRIMVIIGGSVYEDENLQERRPQVSFSDPAGDAFSPPQEVAISSDNQNRDSWIWRVVWNGGDGYGMDYRIADKDAWKLYLMKTRDGRYFDEVSQLEVDGKPNESTIRFDEDDHMYVLIRREGKDKKGLIARSKPPYIRWKYDKLDFQLGGPNFLILDNKKWIVGTRKYIGDRKTQLLVTTPKGEILKSFVLPSGGDTSYPGMLVYGEKLWVTYYSSHEEGTNIYLTKIPLEGL